MSHVITGRSAISAAGYGVDCLWQALMKGDPLFSEIPLHRYGGADLLSPRAAFIPGLEGDWMAERCLEWVIRGALKDANLSPNPQIHLIFATSLGNLSGPWQAHHDQNSSLRMDEQPRDPHGDQTPDEFVDAPQGEPPHDLVDLQRYGPGHRVAKRLNLGACLGVSVACASGTAALAAAMAHFATAQPEAIVVAGVDILSRFVHGGFDALGALSRGLPRPFHKKRDGLLLGEGAAALVIQPRERVEAKHVKTHILGVGMASDAYHITSPAPDGSGCAQAMIQALDMAELPPQAIDEISVHGTATPYNDRMEWAAMTRVFGDEIPPFHGVKHIIGHCLGAAGLIELVVALEGLNWGDFPRAYGQNVLRRGPAQRVLCTNSAFGGVNASVVLGAQQALTISPRKTAIHPQLLCEKTRKHRDFLALPPGGWPRTPHRYAKMEGYCQWVLILFEEARQKFDFGLDGLAVILVSQLSCQTTDLRHHQRLSTGGVRAISRREFAHTVPGAPLSHLALHYDLKGIQLTVGANEQLAYQEAEGLLHLGMAKAVIVIFAEVFDDEGASTGRVVYFAKEK